MDEDIIKTFTMKINNLQHMTDAIDKCCKVLNNEKIEKERVIFELSHIDAANYNIAIALLATGGIGKKEAIKLIIQAGILYIISKFKDKIDR